MLVELSKRDLLNYSMKDLRLIAKHRRLKQTGSKAFLAERIAVSLMSHKAEMTSEFAAEKARLLSRRFDYGTDHGVVLRADGSIFCWGTNDMGQCDAPAGNDYIAVAAGDRYSFAVKSDGSIVKWGNTSRLPINNTGFVDVATGSQTNMGLKGDGSVVLWDINPEIPQQIIRGDFIHIVARGDVFAALSRSGSVSVWQMGLASQVLQGNYIDMTIDTENDEIDTLSSTGNVIATYEWDDNFLIDNNNFRELRYNEEFIAISGQLALKMDGELINVYDNPLPDDISNQRYMAISKGPYLYILADNDGKIYEYNYAVGTFRQITDNNSPVLISTSVESGGQPDIQALPPQPYDQTVAEEIITDYLKVLTTEELQRATMDSIIDFLPYNLTANEKDEIKTFIKNKYKEILQTAIDENNVEKINAIERWATANQSGQMIMMVMRYRQSQRAQAAADDDEDEETPEEAKVCNNPTDMISLEKWSKDYLPDVKLRLLDERERTVCFERDSLLRYMMDTNNQLALWIPNNMAYSVTQLDDNGHLPPLGAGPCRSVRLYRLPDATNTHIMTNLPIDSLRDIKGIPVAKKIRIGNLHGTYGSSESHGQTPGVTLYLVVKEEDDVLTVLKDHLEKMLNKRTRFREQMQEQLSLTDDSTSPDAVLQNIREIYRLFPAEDADYECLRINPSLRQAYYYPASPVQPAPQQPPPPDAAPDVASILNFGQAESDDEFEVYNEYGSFIDDHIDYTSETQLRNAFLDNDTERINEIIETTGDTIIRLDLSDISASDISPLSGLQNLQTLLLYSAGVNDLRPLSGLLNLETLDLAESLVTDLEPLRGLNIRKLDLSGTGGITDITPLASLTDLEELDLSNTGITDLTPLVDLPNLQRLTVGSEAEVPAALVDTLSEIYRN